MAAEIIDGQKIAKEMREGFTKEVEELKRKGVVPGLAVVLVGENSASKVYVSMKKKACQQVGFYSEEHKLSVDTTNQELLKLIHKLNSNDKIDGILVQLPLPKQIDEDMVLEEIDSQKDVDGFHPYNMGLLLASSYKSKTEPLFQPCTPFGVMKMLEYYKVDLKGKNAVVIGRSNIVGKPIALMLLREDATVTICHSRTADLRAEVKKADIIIAAIGKPKFVTVDMVKEGAVVIDVGVNRLEDGSLVGDVDYDEVAKKASLITPVPGGVGPMTITMLLYNTLKAAKVHHHLLP
ncbi:MAG: bifunctional methylenetetrahydrofolate dehydrogenase/methenyltetrahydrofolate cyclohydrolase FolD [bacterium]